MKRGTAKAEVGGAAGFSLLELIIAMAVTLTVVAVSGSLLTGSLRTRMRENRRTEALAAAQRALHTMSREIANSGFGLTDNGIIAADSGPTSIRLRSNINNTNLVTGDPDEDVTYTYQPANSSLVRYDKNSAVNKTNALAGQIGAFRLTYLDRAGVETSAANTARVRIDIVVSLPPVTGQPPSQVQLTSEVALRNAPDVLSRY